MWCVLSIFEVHEWMLLPYQMYGDKLELVAGKNKVGTMHLHLYCCGKLEVDRFEGACAYVYSFVLPTV